MACPDPTDKPARTILTGSGGRGASRMKHIIETGNGEPDRRYRILTPDELDQLQRFPKGWTSAGGLTDSQRTFCMGNALVTDIPRKIAVELASSIR
jgi:DNA (cytosine-5)-methyltransferase 1